MQMKMAFQLALVMAAAMSASPALAQKGGHGHDDGRGHHESEARGRRDDRNDDYRRDARRRDDRRQDDRRWRSSSDRRLQRRVPAGWCIGRGNPHNTVANCGPGANRYNRRYDPRYNRNGTWNRNGSNGTWNRNGTSGTWNRNGSYGTSGRQAYDQWKRSHDQRCHDLARQRPLDLRWQQQVRTQCAAEERDARNRYRV